MRPSSLLYYFVECSATHLPCCLLLCIFVRLQAAVVSLVCEQRVLEYMEAGSFDDALALLRDTLSNIHPEPARVHLLASLVMYTEPKRIRAAAAWDGAKGQSRALLLAKLQEYIPAVVLVPEGRLFSLLDGAVQHQISKCSLHQKQNSYYPLLEDHTCTAARPHASLCVLERHTDEVLYVQVRA